MKDILTQSLEIGMIGEKKKGRKIFSPGRDSLFSRPSSRHAGTREGSCARCILYSVSLKFPGFFILFTLIGGHYDQVSAL